MQKPTYKMKSISLIFILRVRAPFSAVTLSSTEVSNFPKNSLVFHAFPHFVVLPLITKNLEKHGKLRNLQLGKLEISAEERAAVN